MSMVEGAMSMIEGKMSKYNKSMHAVTPFIVFQNLHSKNIFRTSKMFR